MTKNLYLFRQNNPGGRLIQDDKVDKYVFIQAYNHHEANRIAEYIGIYFDGVRRGSDCACCGDRWYRADEYETVDRETFEVVLSYNTVPDKYGKVAIVYTSDGTIRHTIRKSSVTSEYVRDGATLISSSDDKFNELVNLIFG